MAIKLTWKIWLLIIVLVLSLISIFGIPSFEKGVVISSVETNTTAFDQGLRKGQIITSVDGNNINSIEDYSEALKNKFTSNESVKTTLIAGGQEFILFSNVPPQITVANVAPTNLKLGLDLSGGARALIQAKDKDLSPSEINDLIAVMSNRLNVFGISDLTIVPVSDLSGKNFVLIEIAGATPKDLEQLISQQGKFEAKIANDTVFVGGEKDIASVCRNDATCAGIEGCFESGDGGYYCNFRFSIYLSEDAAKRHADLTKDIPVNSTPQGNYLSEKLDLFLDDQLVDSLLISESLKGRVTTQIAISGSGTGATRDEAIENAQEQMHHLQTILITGSLPYQLEIVKLDAISPVFGQEFTKYLFVAGAAALFAVVLIIFLRYRNFKFSAALLLTSLSEIIIILGIAALIEWNLDFPSIAGILATVGTGVDDLIVLMDESKLGSYLSLKQRLKRAFAIILGAYFTSVVSLLPLMWAGAGLLKGFAITTIIGISVGVLITRPAFSDILKMMGD